MTLPVTTSWGTSPASGTTASHSLTSIPDGSWMILTLTIGANTYTITPPAGWTVLMPMQNMGSRRSMIVAKIKTSGDTTVAWTTSTAVSKRSTLMWGTGAAPVAEWLIGVISVRSLGAGESGSGNGAVQGGTSTTVKCASITTPGADYLAIGIGLEATSATETDVSSVAGGTKWFFSGTDSTFIESCTTVTLNKAVAGATGDMTITYPNSQTSNALGIQIGIKPASVAPPIPMGLQIKKGDGSTAYFSYLNGSGTRVAPASIKTLLRGFNSTAEMEATPGATWAHRGGSASYAEHSEYAYDQAALRGYGALEISCQRSSDGWWFAMHDTNFDSFMATTGTPNASTLTRAQIEAAYVNKLRPISGWPQRAIIGLEELLEKWGNTHVLILDPKNGLSFNTEFLSLADGIVNPNRLVWKYYMGSLGSTSPSNGALAAYNRGWKTWGYHYEADIDSGAFAEHSGKPQWTYLGLTYSSTQAYWDTMLAVGKPVVGHICPDQAAYNTAISKGADMVQCSGVGVITAVRPAS